MLPQPLRFLHPHLHFTGLLLMVAGLPFSLLLMSLSQFFLLGNWILEGGYREKWMRFMDNKPAILLCGLFLFYIPSIAWSSNFDEAIKLLRLNLPFLVIPFVLGSVPALSERSYWALLRLFHLSVFLAVLACCIWGLPKWISGEFNDIRQVSLFISHIRFSLLIALSVLLQWWALLYKPYHSSKSERLISLGLSVIMLVFLIILQSLNGLIIFCLVLFFWLLYECRHRLGLKKTAGIASIIGLSLLSSGWYIGNLYKDYFTPDAIYQSSPDYFTASGNPYRHEHNVLENGHYIYAYLCEKELYETWPLRSKIQLDSNDAKGHPLFITLVRYLNSKGLRKDRESVLSLSDSDVRFIEQGIANYKYTGLLGIRMRFYQLLYELDYIRRDGSNPSGHTLFMKLEFWKNSVALIQEAPLVGHGIGDVPDVFRKKYSQTNSWLSEQWWMTSHNQFLYVAVGCGIIGMLVFGLLLVLPAFIARAFSHLPFLLFFSVAALSMISEDTLTTQAGVSLVAFFYAFFLFARPRMNTSEAS